MQYEYYGSFSALGQKLESELESYLLSSKWKKLVFVGRSNAGKSSLINSFSGEKLARTSQSPGKTTAIHFFVNAKEKLILVDLPGYGFAHRSKEEREKWRKLIESYFDSYGSDHLPLVLMDPKVGATQLDIEAIEFFEALDLDTSLVFTKWDRLKRQKDKNEAIRRIQAFGKQFELPKDRIFRVSSVNGAGIPELRASLCH